MESQNIIQGKYKKLARIGEGSGGKVYLVEKIQTASDTNENAGNPNIPTNIPTAISQKPGKSYFALKKFKQYGKNANNTTHQIDLLSTLNHSNVIKFDEVFLVDKGYKKNNYVLMQYCMDALDFFKFKQISLTNSLLKQIIWQLVSAVEYLHENNIIHRDIKPSNVLIARNGTVRLSDFDIASVVKEQMTKNMVTRYYRPPEMMFGSNTYSFEVDIWSLGCTIAELILEQPLFPGSTDIDQLEKIFTVLGTPLKTWPQAQNYPYFLNFVIESQKGLQNILPVENQQLLDLIKRMLVLNPQNRITIQDAKEHPYFNNIDTDYSELAKITSYIIDKKIKQLVK